PMDPVTLGLCTQIDLDFEVQRAAKEKPVVEVSSGATLLPASETTRKEDQVPEPVGGVSEKSREQADDAEVFAKLKQLGGGKQKEGAGKAGCPRHPWPRTPLRVRGKRNATGPDRTSASLRNGFNGLLRALPGDRADVATVACD